MLNFTIGNHYCIIVMPGITFTNTAVFRTMRFSVKNGPAEDGPLTILYEDDYLLAVDKPAGMLIHPSRSCFCGTLANYVAGYYARTGQKSAFHPMTRLDRDTFGVVLLAKNAHVHTLLQNTPVQKTYHALVLGGPEAETGVIDAPIARKPLPSLLREIREDGKPSVTRYQMLERNGELCKLALEPVTGRTHQLRLHCMHMGFPILGDPQYNNLESMALSGDLGLSHQLLCAKSLKLIHPIMGTELEILSKMDILVKHKNKNPLGGFTMRDAVGIITSK